MPDLKWFCSCNDPDILLDRVAKTRKHFVSTSTACTGGCICSSAGNLSLYSLSYALLPHHSFILLFTGMFDNLKAIPEQRCAPPGSNLTVQVEMHPDGSLAKAAGSGDPTNQTEFEILLAGGHRNRITQPVSLSSSSMSTESRMPDFMSCTSHTHPVYVSKPRPIISGHKL